MSINTSVTVGSATTSNWIPLDTYQSPFNVSLSVDLNSAASGITYDVEHTFDSLAPSRVVEVSRSTTTVTVTFLDGNHGLNTGDSIIIRGFPNEVGGTAISGINGVYTVTVSSATVLTYTSAESATSGPYICKAAPLRVWDHEFLAAKLTSDDGNYAYPVTACRLNVTAWTAGQATLTVMQG